MTRWIGPVLVAIGAAVLGWYGGLALSTYGLMEAAIRRISAEGGVNVMRHGTLPTAENQPIVRPSPDLAYSSCPYDLSKGPLLIKVTPAPGRYSSLSIFDARTDVVFVRNDQQAGGKAYQIILARADQAVPKGTEVVRVDYDRGIALIRLLLRTPAEIGTLDPVRRQSRCQTL